MFCKCGYSLSGLNMFLLEQVDDIQFIITFDSLSYITSFMIGQYQFGYCNVEV